MEPLGANDSLPATNLSSSDRAGPIDAVRPNGPDAIAKVAAPTIDSQATLDFSSAGHVLEPTPPNVPGYVILGVLGRGGMGVVYKAQHLALKRTVALKMILSGGHAGERERQRFRAEAEAVARLQHPNIVQVHEVGEHEGLLYAALEFVESGTLAQKLNGKPLPPRESARLIETLAIAVQLAHSRNIVHRDLKPANILLTAAGIPKVTDFGLARQLDGDSGQTRTGAVLGTPSYMSPEQAGGTKDVGLSTDVYALGAILYECLTGQPPFKGKSIVETLDMVRNQEPIAPRSLRPALPSDVETICLKCLEKMPEARYSSAAALADDLGRFLRGEPIQARPVGMWERVGKWIRRYPAYAGFLGAGTVAVLALVAFGVSRTYQSRLSEANTRLEDSLQEAKAARTAEANQRTATDLALRRVERFRYVNLVVLASRELMAGELGRAEDLLEQCPENLRGWEWHYLRNSAHMLHTTSRSHSDRVECLAYSADGERLASGARDGSIHIRDENFWREKALVISGHIGPVRAVAFHPDGNTLFSAGDDGTVRFVELSTLRDVFQKAPSGPRYRERLKVRRHEGPVRALACSPDGSVLASAGQDGIVRLTDAKDGREIHRLIGHKGSISTLVFDSNAKRVASAGEDRSVRIWDTATGQLLTQLGPLAGPIAGLSWDRDGNQIAAAIDESGKDRTIEIWNIPNKQLARSIRGHPAGTMAVAFNALDRQLASVGRDGSLRLWNAEDGRLIYVLKAPAGPLTCVAFRGDGNFLASGGGRPSAKGEVLIWKMSAPHAGQRLPAHTNATSVAFTLIGDRLVSAGRDGLVKIIDHKTKRIISTFQGHEGAVHGIAVSPDLLSIASAGQDGTVRMWDLPTAQPIRTLKGHSGPVLGVAFSADGKRLASVGGSATSGELIIWDANDGSELLKRTTSVGPLAGVAFDDESRTVAAGGPDGIVRLWDSYQGSEKLQLRGHTGPVLTLAFSPNRRLLASAGEDKAIRIWDAATGKLVHVLAGHHAEIRGLGFNEDGSRLGSASMDGDIKLWDSEIGHEACTLSACPSGVTAIAFGSERCLAAANADGTMIVWEAPTWRPDPEIDHD